MIHCIPKLKLFSVRRCCGLRFFRHTRSGDSVVVKVLDSQCWGCKFLFPAPPVFRMRL